MDGEGMNCGREGGVSRPVETWEGRVERRGAHLDEPAEPQETDAEHDEAAQEGEAGRDLGRAVDRAALRVLDVLDHSGDLERHDGDGPDRDVFGRGEEGVNTDADEGRVQAVLERERGDLGVGL